MTTVAVGHWILICYKEFLRPHYVIWLLTNDCYAGGQRITMSKMLIFDDTKQK